MDNSSDSSGLEKRLGKLEGYFFENISSSIFVLLSVVGATVFLIYFANISYMPMFDFMSSVTLIASISATALFLVCAIIVLFLLPGIYWKSYLKGNSKIAKGIWKREKGEHNQMVMFSFSMPFASWFLLISALAYYSESQIFFATLLFLSLCTLIGTVYCFTKTFSLSTNESISEFLEYYFSSLPAAATAMLLLYGMSKISVNWWGDEGIGTYFWTICVWLCIAATNSFIAAKPEDNKLFKQIFQASAIVVVFVGVFTSFIQSLPERIMGLYKFGNINNVTLIVSDKACERLKVIEDLNIGVHIGFCEIKNIKVESRLGTEYLVNSGNKRVFIKSEDVLHMVENVESESEEKEQ